MSPQKGRKRYTRAPEDLLFDRNISDFEYRLFGVLALEVWQGSTVKVEYGELADRMRKSKRQVIRAMGNLEAAGYVSAFRRHNCPNTFVLNSPIFSQKQGKVDVLVSSPKGKRLVSMDNERHGIAV